MDVMAPVQLTWAFLPELIAAGGGFLINVASMAAYTPTPRMAVYGAARAFMPSFTESLWAELRTTGVTVVALSPGATSTECNSIVGTEDATARCSDAYAGRRRRDSNATPRVQKTRSERHRWRQQPARGRGDAADQSPQRGDPHASDDKT